MKRILLIGIGRWGVNHLRVLKSMPIELFVADRHEDRLSSMDIPPSHRSTHEQSLFSKIDAAIALTGFQTPMRCARESFSTARIASCRH